MPESRQAYKVIPENIRACQGNRKVRIFKLEPRRKPSEVMERKFLLFRIWIKFTWHFLYSMRIRGPWSLSPHTWILLFRRGFLPNKLDLYDFQKNNWKSYINDRQLLLTAHINGNNGIVIDDKLLSMLVMRSITSIPRTFAVIHNGNIFLPGSMEAGSLKSLLMKEGRAILKPTDKNGGKEIILLEFRKGVCLKNNKPADMDKLEKSLSKSATYILTEYVQQGEYASSLFPGTVNTIRILTMRDPDSGTPFIACAVQRVGTSKSFPVDNVSSGGLACGIDLRSGRLGKTSRVFMDKPFRWIECHPDTGINFEGLSIPRWKEICTEVEGLARHLPMIPYIAWDIALLDDGIRVIETNSWSDLSVFQLEKPLTEDPKVRRFFEHHQIRKTGTQAAGQR